MLIHTERLRLLTCGREHLEAIVRDPKSLGTELRVSIPDGWPAYPQAYPHALELLKNDPARPYSGWWLYLLIDNEARALVGCGGFKGAPDAEGTVEIGCEIAPAYRGRGLAAEATMGLARYAFTRPEVSAVDAHTLPEKSASTRALEKAGMRRVGEAVDTQAGRVWHWRLTRSAHEHKHCMAA